MKIKTEIVIHCTDTRPEWMEDNTPVEQVDEIRRWHMKDRGWRDIGYNFLGPRAGGTIGGRDLDDDGDFAEETGAHTKGYNSHTIGYALIGGYGGAADDQFEDHFTIEQKVALLQFIDRMEERYGPLKITGHNAYANKSCPCFSVKRWLEGSEKPPRENPVQSTSIRAAVTGVTSVAGAAGGAVAQLEGTNQTVALVFLGAVALLFLYLMKERLRHWGEGVR